MKNTSCRSCDITRWVRLVRGVRVSLCLCVCVCVCVGRGGVGGGSHGSASYNSLPVSASVMSGHET